MFYMKNKMEVLGNIYVAGVYGIRCKGHDSYLYIGSAIEINDALSRHLYNLKRGFYANTNKAILQKYYDMEELVYEVIKESSNENVVNMTFEQKESLQEALSVLEKFYIDLYKDSCCNCQKSVTKHSSNHNEETTYKRRKANLGSNNPHSKYDEQMIANILWLKNNGYNSKQIEQIYQDKGIKSTYICCLGVSKWIHLEPIKPDFIIA